MISYKGEEVTLLLGFTSEEVCVGGGGGEGEEKTHLEIVWPVKQGKF